MIIPHSEATLLAIDTATPACSVALRYQGEVTQQYVGTARKHTELLLPMVDTLLQAADLTVQSLDGIMLSAGPGAFTGLRVGAAVAMGLAAAYQTPIAPVSSLALLAATAYHVHQSDKVLALMDARMGEVYAGLYVLQQGQWVAQLSDRVCPPAELPADAIDAQTMAVGSGLLYSEALPVVACRSDDSVVPQAQYLFDFLAAATWQPANQGIALQYLRNEVTQS